MHCTVFSLSFSSMLSYLGCLHEMILNLVAATYENVIAKVEIAYRNNSFFF